MPRARPSLAATPPGAARRRPRGAPVLAALAALLALATVGCTVDATGALITVHTGGCHTADLFVEVSLANGGRVIAEHDYTEFASIDDGATFGVHLPDSLDGQQVEIAARLSGAAAECSDHVELVVGKHQVIRRELSLLACCALPPDLSTPTDGGADGPPDDLARPDLTAFDLLPGGDLADLSVAGDDGPPPDLAEPDLPDLSMPDLAAPDLACQPGCDQAIQTVCENGVARQWACAFGCSGDHCLGPPSCNAPGDISVPGTFRASSAGAHNTTMASCEPNVGPDNTFVWSGQAWGTWTLTLDAAFPAALSSRLACADPGSELQADGPCTARPPANACVSAGGQSTQVLCGLPPGRSYFSIVEDVKAVGGLYAVGTAFKAVDLNDCENAGMLPGPSFTFSGDTRKQANKNQAPAQVMNCADRGAAAREMVFWVPVPKLNVQPNLAISVTGKNGFLPLVYVRQACQDIGAFCGAWNGGQASASVDHALPGAWVVYVDGQNGSEGEFDLSMTLK